MIIYGIVCFFLLLFELSFINFCKIWFIVLILYFVSLCGMFVAIDWGGFVIGVFLVIGSKLLFNFFLGWWWKNVNNKNFNCNSEIIIVMIVVFIEWY